MNLVGISINHNTAPLELRESLHLNKSEIVEFVPKLREKMFTDGFVLSTCNRTEIFGFPKTNILDFREIIDFLLEFKPVEGISYEHFNKYFSCSAVKHIFNVSAGIDSMMLGDSQILGQLKSSFEIASDLKFSGSILTRIFDAAIKVGKRSITETRIGEGAVSVSYAAIQVVEKVFSNLHKKSALVIGAGETGELAAIHLRDKGVGKIAITNRTLSKAERLSKKIHGEIIHYEFFKEHLHNFDIIVSATSSESLIINRSDIQKMMKQRKGTPCCLMDIAVPRDIDPDVRKINNVFYHDIDSLRIIVDQNIKKRSGALPAVKKIVLEEMINFFSWYNTLEVVPTIKSVREFFEIIRNDELEKIKHKVSDEDFIKMEDMTRRLIGRLLHNPTIKLRQLAENGTNFDQVAVHAMIVKELFGLNGSIDNNKNDEESIN